MATPTDDDNADDCISGNYYGYERGGTRGVYPSDCSAAGTILFIKTEMCISPYWTNAHPCFYAAAMVMQNLLPMKSQVDYLLQTCQTFTVARRLK